MTFVGWSSQLLGIENDSRAYSDAVNEYIVSRYGSMKNFRNAMIQDPAGVAADLSLFASVTNLALRTGLTATSISSAVKTPANLTKGFSKTLTVSEEIASALDPLTTLGNVAKHNISKIQLEAIQKILKFIEDNGLLMSRLKAALGLMGTEKMIENQQSK